MKDERKTKEQLINELVEMRQRVAGLEASEAEREWAEERLWLLSSAVEQSTEGIAMSDLEGNLLFANNAFATMHGYTAEELVGKPLSVFHTAEQMPSVEVANRQIQEGGEFSGEIWHVRRDGTVFPTLMHNSLLRDEGGNAIGMIGTLRDITERKREEEALRESEEKYRTLVEQSLQGLVVVQDFRIVFANTAFAEISAYTVEELLSLAPEEVKAMVHPKDQTLVWGRFRDRLLGKPVPPRYEYRGVRKDGTVCWLEMSATRIEYRGKPAIQGVVVDITERKRAEEGILQRTAQLEALREVGLELTAELDLDALLYSIVSRAVELLGGTSGGLDLYQPEQNVLEWSYIVGPSPAPAGITIQRGEGLSGKIWETGEPLIVDDYQHWEGRAEACEGLLNVAVVGAPLHWGEEFLGVLLVEADPSRAFSPADAELLNLLATQAAIAIRNARLYEQAQREIAERRRLENEIEERRLYLESVLACAPDAIVTLDAQHNLLEWNPGAERLFGYTLEEVVGRNIDDLVTGSDTNALEEAGGLTQRVLAGKSVSPTETVRYRKDGCPVDVIVSGSPILIGNEMVGVVAVYTDITERKRAGQLLQALNEAALAMERALTHEEIFAAVAKEFEKLGLSCMVFPTDESQGRLFPKYLSYESKALKAVEKLVGVQHEDFSIPIEAIDVFREVVWEQKAAFGKSVEEVLRQVLPEPAKKFTGQIIRTLKISGFILAPLIVEDKVIGVLSVQSDDLTEEDVPVITAFGHQVAAAWHKANLMENLERSLRELRQTQAQLLQLQKMEAIGQLAAGIAHDFNNLLTPMGGFADLLLRKAPEGSREQKYLHEIKIATRRAAALTSQLRLFARQQKGRRRSVQLNNLVEETRALLERSIPKKITIELRTESELWAVEADSSQISQVLMNLGLNARDAMLEGGTLTLETRNVTLDEEYAQTVLEAQPGRYVRLSVSDTGCGMSPEVQARIFEPFFTTKERGEGTGLGLSVVYGIVKGHEGFITVYSEEGRGSTFHVYLPAVEGVVEEREAKELEWPTGTETILVVDDEDGVRALGQAVLEECGYSVLMAEDGLQALEVYQAHQGEIALVVLDVIMPRMNGQECLRRLREMDPGVKVLISTGYTVRGVAEELLAEGALGVVEKPFRIQDFATAVRTTIDR